MVKRLSKLVLFCCVITLTLSGCFNKKDYQETQQNIQNAGSGINQAYKNINQKGLKATQNTYKQDQLRLQARQNENALPSWLQKKIVLKGKDLPLSYLLKQILQKTPINIAFGKQVQRDKKISINFSGTVKQALDYLSLQSNYAYQIRDHIIYWSAFMIKTYEISFLPEYASESNAGAGDAENIEDTWSDIIKTVQNMLSPEGRLNTSKSLTLMTVRDRPANIHAITHFINQINETLSRQVLIKITILELHLNKEFRQGIDWNLAGKFLSNFGKFSLVDSMGQIAHGATFSATVTRGDFAGSRLLINALNQQGDVSIVTEPTAVTLNNQVAQIKIQHELTYIGQLSTTLFDYRTLTTNVNPSVVTDGLTLYLLPKIWDNRIYLQIKAELDHLKSLDTHKYKDGDKTIEIQTPTLLTKKFTQRAILPSGGTLILSGFKQVRSEIDDSSMFGVDQLGAEKGKRQHSEIVILVTPYVSGKSLKNSVEIASPDSIVPQFKKAEPKNLKIDISTTTKQAMERDLEKKSGATQATVVNSKKVNFSDLTFKTPQSKQNAAAPKIVERKSATK